MANIVTTYLEERQKHKSAVSATPETGPKLLEF